MDSKKMIDKLFKIAVKQQDMIKKIAQLQTASMTFMSAVTEVLPQGVELVSATQGVNNGLNIKLRRTSPSSTNVSQQLRTSLVGKTIKSDADVDFTVSANQFDIQIIISQ
jgi:hypothetical protein